MERCAVIDDQGNIVNVIMADPTEDSVQDHVLVASDTAAIGGTYLEGVFMEPPAPAVPAPTLPTIADLQTQLAVLTSQLAALAAKG